MDYYTYQENQTMSDINARAGENWFIASFSKNPEEQLFDVMYVQAGEPLNTFVQNPQTGSEFFMDKTITYGDLILIIFCSIFLISGVFKFLWNFVWQDIKAKL